MPKENTISCPACGFSLKAGSKTCEFCGYEFEDDDFSMLQTSSKNETVGSLQNRQSQRGTASKNGSKKSNGTKKGSKSQSRSSTNGKNGGNKKSRTGAQTVDVQAETVAETVPAYASDEAEDNTQARIKELEKQLTDAEKELDVISKLLGQERDRQPADEQQASAEYVEMAGGAVHAPAAAPQVIPSSFTSPPPPASASTSWASDAAVTGSSAARSRLFFRFRGMTFGAIVVGLMVYALSYLLSSNIGRMEMYLLILPASILVALGLYASLEGSPASQRL